MPAKSCLVCYIMPAEDLFQRHKYIPICSVFTAIDKWVYFDVYQLSHHA